MIKSKLSIGFSALVFFTNSNLMELQVGYLGSFLSFLSKRQYLSGSGLGILMGTYIQFMLVFLRTPYLCLVLWFFYYALMTLQMMLSVILLSILLVLLSTVKVIRCLISGSNWGSF